MSYRGFPLCRPILFGNSTRSLAGMWMTASDAETLQLPALVCQLLIIDFEPGTGQFSHNTHHI